MHMHEKNKKQKERSQLSHCVRCNPCLSGYTEIAGVYNSTTVCVAIPFLTCIFPERWRGRRSLLTTWYYIQSKLLTSLPSSQLLFQIAQSVPPPPRQPSSRDNMYVRFDPPTNSGLHHPRTLHQSLLQMETLNRRRT